VANKPSACGEERVMGGRGLTFRHIYWGFD
jgi:hypothetical protein